MQDAVAGNRSNDTGTLAGLGVAKVQSINFTALVGAGILHTKLWIADNLHFYVGSANTDWRSLTEVSTYISKHSNNIISLQKPIASIGSYCVCVCRVGVITLHYSYTLTINILQVTCL